MKNLLFITAILLYMTKNFALPVGNSVEASLFYSTPCTVKCELNSPSFEGWNIHIGYYGDYVFNRNLETIMNKHIDYSHMTTNAGYLALNCWNLLDCFATFGTSKFSLNTSLSAFNAANPSPRFELETSTAFSWSVGARATLFRYKCFSLGAMGQYFTFKPHTDVWFIRANISANSSDDKSRYSEWQLGAGAAYHYSRYFVSYIAIKWSRALWEFNGQSLYLTGGGPPVATILNLKSSKQLGCAVGLSFAPFECKNLAVTVEGRFGDESALHINGQLFF